MQPSLKFFAYSLYLPLGYWPTGINGRYGEYPDEFFFHIAGARLGIQSPKVPFVPLYGDHECRLAYKGWIGEQAVMDQHIGTMLYGLNPPNQVVGIYHMLVKRYHEYLPGLRSIKPFNHVSKTKVGIVD